MDFPYIFIYSHRFDYVCLICYVYFSNMFSELHVLKCLLQLCSTLLACSRALLLIAVSYRQYIHGGFAQTATVDWVVATA